MKDLYGELFCYTRFEYWLLICGLSFGCMKKWMTDLESAQKIDLDTVLKF
jgi:hypothetical protein